MMFGCHINFYSSFFKRSVIFFNSARIAFIGFTLFCCRLVVANLEDKGVLDVEDKGLEL